MRPIQFSRSTGIDKHDRVRYTIRMSKMLAIRIDEELIEQVDRERKRGALTRARVIRDALGLWLENERLRQAVARHRDGYDRAPVTDDEFRPVLGAQQWPR